MKHGVKKIKFNGGRDANRALMRKLALNFLKHGRIDTTLNRGKALKGLIDRLTHKAQRGNQSDKNVLLKHLAQKDAVNYMLETVGPAFKNRQSGFVTIAKLGPRQGDVAEIVRVQWVKNLKPAEVKEVVEKKTTKAKPAKAEPKKATKKVEKTTKKVEK